MLSEERLNEIENLADEWSGHTAGEVTEQLLTELTLLRRVADTAQAYSDFMAMAEAARGMNVHRYTTVRSDLFDALTAWRGG